MTEKKNYFSYNDVHKTIRKLAEELKNTSFKPDWIVAIGSGGFIPARILKTFIGVPILTVGVAYYDLNNKPTDSPTKIQWINETEARLEGKKILLVDEVDDTRVTLEYCLTELLKHNPEEIAVMVLHNKEKKKKGEIPEAVNRYYAGISLKDEWICYPWDADDIEEQDRQAKKRID